MAFIRNEVTRYAVARIQSSLSSRAARHFQTERACLGQGRGAEFRVTSYRAGQYTSTTMLGSSEPMTYFGGTDRVYGHRPPKLSTTGH